MFRLVDLSTATPDILVVILESGLHNAPGAVSLPDQNPAAWSLDGSQPSVVSCYAMPWDEEKAIFGRPNLYPVTMRYWVFLRLPQTFQEGRTYFLSTPYGTRTWTFRSWETRCESIKVNQVGYNQRCTSRYANFGVYLGDGGSLLLPSLPPYEVVHEPTGTVVYQGMGSYVGNDTTVSGTAVSSGEQVYRLRLDAVPPGGPYFISVPGCGRSYSFGIGDEYSRQLARTITRGLYHQRCGIALEAPYTQYTRPCCHAEVVDTRTIWSRSGFISASPLTPRKPISGGYHDAGDFDRRPFHTIISVLMLSYFDSFPGNFVDNQYNIPESGDGMPDFLSEALWGVRLWENLQVTEVADPDCGGVCVGTETFANVNYGIDSAANDRRLYGTWEVQVEHTATCAGIFAQAARLVQRYDPTRAQALLARAELAWGFLLQRANVGAPKTCFLYAALQLYLATGELSYHSLFQSAANAIVLSVGVWPEQYQPGNSNAFCQTAHFVSYLLAHGRSVDSAFAYALRAKILQFADRGGYMGPPPENLPYPQGVTKSLGWGSGTAQGRYADLYAFAWLFTTDPVKKQRYFNAVSQYADYALGLNPLGISYYTGLGSSQLNSPLQCDSYFTKEGLSDGLNASHQGQPKGNVPGILVYGPTMNRSAVGYQKAVSDKLYPTWDNLPGQRRYAQGWSLINSNEFTTWETMVWNVVMHGFLYNAGQ
ncbi:glycoside hydrolase family 9 protein [Armatimonas rosea]|uniref:Endoglucanase n=1 Tax=Armatimonas rosea TaxID=685828 RepID=A0A7W9SMX5_ARMRO|nr:glycoside hydrolase family 9 protein [Armatimonas rosea]MBB6049580.1 endoglucanase [Armatimonas rosea]